MKKQDYTNIFEIARIHLIGATFIGFLAGVLYSFGGLIIDATTTGLNQGTALAFFALLGMPALAGLSGFFAGLIIALFYNIALYTNSTIKKIISS